MKSRHWLVAALVHLSCAPAPPAADATEPPSEHADEPPEAAAPEEGGDPLGASPDVYEVLSEDDRFRVLRATWAPGQRDAWHRHPRLVAYALTPVKGVVHLADGDERPRDLPERALTYQAAVKSHAFENTSDREVRMLLVEMKPGAEANKPSGKLPDAATASPDVYQVKLDLDQVRILLATWKPKQKDKPHAHPARATYYLTALTGREAGADGKRQDLEIAAGTAVVEDAVAAHAVENTGAEAEALIFELK
jgi:quercetin dioxygenase-like cupin family protein